MKNIIKNAVLRLKIRFHKWEAYARWSNRDHWITKFKPSFSETTLHYLRRLESVRVADEQKALNAKMASWEKEWNEGRLKRIEDNLALQAKLEREIRQDWALLWKQNGY